MRRVLPSVLALAAVLACSDQSTSAPQVDPREAVASVVGGITFPLVKITGGGAALAVGDSLSLQVSLQDGVGTWMGKYITWTTSDSSVLKITVTNVGMPSGSVAHVKALKAGKVSLTATTQSLTSAKIPLTVAPATAKAAAGDTVVTKVTVTPNPVSLSTGSKYQLTGKAFNAAGAQITTAKITWKTTNVAVLSVSSTGLVTGMGKGSATVEGWASNGKYAWSTMNDTGGVAPAIPPTTGAKQAVASDVFVGSIGVATHFNYYDLTPYGTNRAKTVSTLLSSGFRFIRDGLNVDVNSGSNDAYWGTMKQLTQAGMKLILVTQPAYLGNQKWVTAPYANQSNLDTAVTRVGASGILAWEGPNEVDNNNAAWGGWPQFATNAKLYQAAMYRHAHAIAPGVPVLGFTTTSAYGSAPVGDISANMDFANMHPYPGGGVPTQELTNMRNSLSVLNGASKVWWATETGYYTAPNATVNVFQPGVSEAAQSKYVPRLYLDFFMNGVPHTASYELIDERSDRTNAEMNYGLLHNDGSPKPAYTSVTNLIKILSDPGATFAPKALDYTLTGATATLRQQLFQKRDGRFYLALWNDVKTFDLSSKRDVTNAPVAVTVTFAAAPTALKLYTPLASSMGVSLARASTVAIQVPDHAVILEVTP